MTTGRIFFVNHTGVYKEFSYFPKLSLTFSPCLLILSVSGCWKVSEGDNNGLLYIVLCIQIGERIIDQTWTWTCHWESSTSPYPDMLGMVGERKRCKAVFCFLNVLFIANHSFLLIFWEHTVFKSCFQKLLCLTWKTSTVMIEFICMKIFYCSQITCINIEDWSNLFCAFCFHLVLCQNISLKLWLTILGTLVKS